ncbi:MAG: HNH endonuclease [Phycisphaerae bacterium]|nr:HNH endonuclease [Phycisphaerae bacterium]
MPSRPPVFGTAQATPPPRPIDNRPSSSARGYGRLWQKVRLIHLRENPLCVQCLKAGDTVSATVVDHIVPHKGDYARFWNQDNWQSLCARCHNRKTAKEDGGWGRPARGG